MRRTNSHAVAARATRQGNRPERRRARIEQAQRSHRLIRAQAKHRATRAAPSDERKGKKRASTQNARRNPHRAGRAETTILVDEANRANRTTTDEGSEERQAGVSAHKLSQVASRRADVKLRHSAGAASANKSHLKARENNITAGQLTQD